MSGPTTPEGRAELRELFAYGSARAVYRWAIAHGAALLDALDQAQEELRRVIVERDGQYDGRRIAEFERDAALGALSHVRELADELASSPMVGSSSEEQWELDTRRTVGRELREVLDGTS